MRFAVSRVRGNDRNYQGALDAVSADGDAVLGSATRWGVFFGLFGLASNELFVVSAGDVGGVHERLLGLDTIAEAETLVVESTARPANQAPLTREGLHVFRFFEIAHKDVDEIVALSREAWETFEASDAYASEPLGLFCQADRSAELGRMLLVTWYDGLDLSLTHT